MNSNAAHNIVDPAEVEKFASIAEEWWNPNGKFAPLHALNPCRLAFIKEVLANHFGKDSKSLNPFEGLSLLDIGCGGGLIAEPMARLGFRVLGIDASERNVNVAAAHAQNIGLEVSYDAATVQDVAKSGERYDVVLNLEVVEHVPDPHQFLATSAELVGPGGITIVATINKTLKSLLLAKFAAEYVLGWLPVGTHDWNKFMSPQELHRALEKSGLSIVNTKGILFDPLGWTWRLSADTDVNYMIAAERA